MKYQSADIIAQQSVLSAAATLRGSKKSRVHPQQRYCRATAQQYRGLALARVDSKNLLPTREDRELALARIAFAIAPDQGDALDLIENQKELARVVFDPRSSARQRAHGSLRDDRADRQIARRRASQLSWTCRVMPPRRATTKIQTKEHADACPFALQSTRGSARATLNCPTSSTST